MRLENKPKIMIVDDVPANIKILLTILADDYKIFIATSGHQALTAIINKPVDLILLDIIMPEIDGFEVCRRLKANTVTKDIPIIFITGVCDAESEKKGLDLGAVDYIYKPFSPAVVKARVNNHLTLQASLLQLKQQNQMLQEAENLRKQVEGITRHDMKSPLNGIIGFSDFLLSVKDIPLQYLECLRIIRREGFRALHMVNLSLELLKMEQGTFILIPKKVNLITILHEIKDDLDNLIQLKQLNLIIYNNGNLINQENFFIWGEELLCFSLFSNLLKNAIEASPSHTDIVINFYNEGLMNAIAIRNYGTVPEIIRERFFEKYITFGKTNGTGLGTYSAKLIAEAQGGSISLQPSDGQHTVIIVYLPNVKEHDSNV